MRVFVTFVLKLRTRTIRVLHCRNHQIKTVDDEDDCERVLPNKENTSELKIPLEYKTSRVRHP